MSENTELGLDEVMTRRFELVEEIAIIEGRHKAELEPLKNELSLCEAFVADHMNQTKTDQVKVNGNLAFFKTGDSVSMSDFDAFINYVLANKATHLLNQAANKTAVKEFIEVNNQPPPGVNYTTFRKVHFRKG